MAIPAALTGTAASADPALAAWAALLDGLPHAAWVVALATRRVVAANAAAATLLGRPQRALVGMHANDLASTPEDLAWWGGVAAGDTAPLHSDALLPAAGGRFAAVNRSIGLIAAPSAPASASASADGAAPAAPRHALVLACDRSVEQAGVAAREALLAELQATLEATADGILVTDLDGGVRSFNRRFAEIWDLPPELLQGDDDAAIRGWMERSVIAEVDGAGYADRVHALLLAPHASSSDRLCLHSGQMLERVTRPLFRGGEPLGRVWSFRDLTARIAAEEKVEALALHDALTGLPNRAGLAAQVQAAATASRRDGQPFALLSIDLDRFRRINDSLGHDTADQVLQDVARRIQGCLRKDDTLARLGGDQFAALIAPADAAAAEATARRVLNIVAQPCQIDGLPFTLTCSIGVALAPTHGLRLDDLGRHADTAMRAAKNGGRGTWRLHQARAEGDRRLQMRLDHAMRQALVSGRFRLHYQPQVDMDSGAIVGAEALLRWRDPELGDVPPSRFIPVAEETGFIVALGDWVLSQAVRQAALWHGRGCGLPIAVNVSALQFQQAQFVDRVASVLAVSGLPPRLLELELTESILVHDADEALHRLHALSRLGLKLSIDDFGTGYSSLAYLKRFPIGKLKIDRSFVMGLPGDDSDVGIVRAILQMARALGMKVIAEGVETEPQREFLHNAGCDEFQGFLFAQALDALSFEQRMLQSRPAPRAPVKHIRLVGN